MRKTTLLKTLLLFFSLMLKSLAGFATTVSHTFSGTNGSVDSNIAFTTQKNSASSAPAFLTELRLYYTSSGDGCSLTLTPSNGAVITQVKITASSASYTPTVKYNVDGGSDATATLASTVYTITGVNAATSLKFRNANTTNTQLRITSIEVTYSIPAVCTASNLAFAEPVVNKLLADAAFTQTASSLNATTAIVYESSNTGVVNVNAATGEVSIVGTGSATITASQAAGSHNSVEYCAATASYTVNVVSAAPTITVTEVTVPDMVAYAGETDTETMNVSGINLTENIRLEISGVNADQFALSTNTVAQVGGTAANTVVSVIYQPTTAGTHTAVLSVLSDGATTVTRALNGSATWKPLAKPVLTGATSVSASALNLNWDAVSGATEYEVNVFTKTTGSASLASDLFISEYIEGSGYNKVIEIYNGTGAAVDLSNYSLFKQVNGAGAYGDELALSGTLLNADVFVISYVSGSNAASAGILAVTDLQTASAAINFNGNDAVGLFKNGIQIDEVGVFNQTASWGTDLTLIRKSSANVPKAIYDAADWDVQSKDYIVNLGAHTFATTGGVTVTPIPGSPFTVSTNSKDLSGLSISTTYYYTVKAKNANVVSELSDEMSVATLGTSVPELNAGLNLRVVGGSIVFDAVADQLVEVYNAVGQRIKSTVTVDGLNTVAVGNKGVILVKVGAQIQKVIL
jgi:hypothetical protein